MACTDAAMVLADLEAGDNPSRKSRLLAVQCAKIYIVTGHPQREKVKKKVSEAKRKQKKTAKKDITWKSNRA